jgi:hypothetical protein
MSSNSETQHITSMKKHACKWMRTVFLKAQMFPKTAVCVLGFWCLTLCCVTSDVVMQQTTRVDSVQTAVEFSSWRTCDLHPASCVLPYDACCPRCVHACEHNTHRALTVCVQPFASCLSFIRVHLYAPRCVLSNPSIRMIQMYAYSHASMHIHAQHTYRHTHMIIEYLVCVSRRHDMLKQLLNSCIVIKYKVSLPYIQYNAYTLYRRVYVRT